MWLSYWKDHFGARSAPPASFNDRSLPSSGAVATTLAEEDGNALLFSEEEVCFALKHMQKWKATADKAPAAAVIALADRLARPLCRLFNECLRSGEVPLSFAGARIVPVYKKKGPGTKCASFRPIALMMLEAKLLARLCLQKLAPRLRYHSMQFGSG
eukprot:5079548-Amphidinium_carterae.1